MSCVGPLSWLLYCVFFCLVRNPAELDSVTEIEGQSGAVPGAKALLGLDRAKWSLIELNRLSRAQFRFPGDTKRGPTRET